MAAHERKNHEVVGSNPGSVALYGPRMGQDELIECGGAYN